MKRPLGNFRPVTSAALCAALLLTTFNFPLAQAQTASSPAAADYQKRFVPVPARSVLEWKDAHLNCRTISRAEQQQLNTVPSSAKMSALNSAAANTRAQSDEETSATDVEADGLNIVLRGTEQLDEFPQARDAFLCAANTWQNLIKTPITVVIDVDFGPTFFGIPFPPFVLGAAEPQALLGGNLYPFYRQALIQSATTDDQRTLFNLLPASSVNTVLGSTRTMSAPSSVLRALGLLPPVPDFELEEFLGPPPFIGFNSFFLPGLDFDLERFAVECTG